MAATHHISDSCKPTRSNLGRAAIGVAVSIAAVQRRRIRALRTQRDELQRELAERRKELMLLHRVTRVLQGDQNTELLLDDFVRLVPSGYRFPENAAARITAGDLCVATPQFRVTPWIQRANFQIRPGERGVLEVAYLVAPRPGTGAPFLPEERSLIDMLSGLLAAYFQRVRRMDERVELMRAQASRNEAEAATRAKDLFLATVSHELRRPLTAILGWAGMLRTGRSADVARGLEVIERSGNNQKRLIEELLDVSRIETGGVGMTSAIVDLNEVLSLVADAATPSVADKHIDMRCALSDQRVPVRGDGMRLQQIVGNLVANAITFTGDGGRLTLSVEQSGPLALIQVADTGVGMDAAQLARVFEPFWQADGSRPTSPKGLGLGLSIAKRLVEMHGGTMEARSDGCGTGTRIAVTLPLVTATQDTRG